MECQACGKKIDEVDCSCGWCTFCGSVFDTKGFTPAKESTENK